MCIKKMELPKELIKELKEIEEDCLRLKKRNDLTEWGEGELHVINLIKKHIKESK
ncbi:hypothetical protein ES703_23792 [subsurface metagenome]